MDDQLTGFIIWILVGCIFIVLGISSACSETPVGFWANIKMFEVTEVKRYNHAVAKLFCVFGIVMIFLGLPLLLGSDPAWILIFSVVGLMVEVIVMMAVYVLVIQKKYKRPE